ncbi:MAG TPA: methylmalonyl Co-A mutase-associated GTPase MeaB [Candidatus Limnocylindria bacterium]|nr:methylmalonyl Co-A mutase-associated GTPase MeaB [Candidatus Limnocylindria bacterium]
MTRHWGQGQGPLGAERPPPEDPPQSLLDRARAGDKRSTARLLSVVENDEPGAAEALRTLYPLTGHAEIVGITGPPGGGKSTLVNRLAGAYRATTDRVAVVAVDPSSPFTGGAILGDRIRMRERFLDEGLFIRSMASRGHSGGLARATSRIVNVLDALGYGVVLVETVGVGQEEVEVVRVADTVCLVTVPGLGDDIQAIKAGVLEIADVLVVNKADRPGADETARDLAQMLTLGKARTEWKPPIVRTTASTGEGLDQLMSAIGGHRAWAGGSGERDRRRRAAARAEVEDLLREALVRRLRDRLGEDRVDRAVARVAERAIDPYAAVDDLLRG